MPKMNHSIYRVESFERVGPQTLRITFNDGLSRVINFESVLHGELLGPLRDPTEFAQHRSGNKDASLAFGSRL
jgi:hypothetical protein